jgi:pimeloyl-ACP methyl ester carboxylesterase
MASLRWEVDMNARVLYALLILMIGTSHALAADDVIDGRLGPGALYRLVRPPNWNGNLVLYAHGDVSTEEDVSLPAEAEIIIPLLSSQGFAVAFSSYSENGWAVKDGVQRTHQLLGIFTSKFGQPTRVYISGASMGGLIAIELAEKYPGVFAGALPTCAVAGGAVRQVDYLANVRVLFDLFYPHVLPGDAGHVPANINVQQAIVVPAAAAIILDSTGAGAIARIAQTPLPFTSPSELLESIVTALALHAGGFEDLIDRTHGHPFFDNRRTVYTGALPQAALDIINATVERFDASPSALQYLDRNYEPSGDLRIPMLMLSTSRDPDVPRLHPLAYLNAVAATGSSDLLVQREINRYGHCNFTLEELGAAFTDLVRWVELGIKPTP